MSEKTYLNLQILFQMFLKNVYIILQMITNVCLHITVE